MTRHNPGARLGVHGGRRTELLPEPGEITRSPPAELSASHTPWGLENSHPMHYPDFLPQVFLNNYAFFNNTDSLQYWKDSDNKGSEQCIATNNVKTPWRVQTCWKPAILYLHITMAELIKIKPDKQIADNLQLLKLKSVVRYSLNLDTNKLGRRRKRSNSRVVL